MSHNDLEKKDTMIIIFRIYFLCSISEAACMPHIKFKKWKFKAKCNISYPEFSMFRFFLVLFFRMKIYREINSLYPPFRKCNVENEQSIQGSKCIGGTMANKKNCYESNIEVTNSPRLLISLLLYYTFLFLSPSRLSSCLLGQ